MGLPYPPYINLYPTTHSFKFWNIERWSRVNKNKDITENNKVLYSNTTGGYVKILFWTKCKKQLILTSKMTSAIPH